MATRALVEAIRGALPESEGSGGKTWEEWAEGIAGAVPDGWAKVNGQWVMLSVGRVNVGGRVIVNGEEIEPGRFRIWSWVEIRGGSEGCVTE